MTSLRMIEPGTPGESRCVILRGYYIKLTRYMTGHFQADSVFCENSNKPASSIKDGNIFGKPSDCRFPLQTLFRSVTWLVR